MSNANVNLAVLAAVRRSDQKFAEQLAQRESLDFAVAYFALTFPDVAALNFVVDAPTDVTPVQLAAIDSFFAAHGVRCFGLLPALMQTAPRPMAIIQPGDFAKRPMSALEFPAVAAVPAIPPELTLISARALRRTYTQLVDQWLTETTPNPAQNLAAHLERLNDPQYDAFVARRADVPVGIVSVFQCGDIGRVRDLFVAPEHRRRGLGAALLAAAVQTARRWSLRIICAACDAENVAANRTMQRAGFVAAGEMTEFWRLG